jgi:UPF0271 protein
MDGSVDLNADLGEGFGVWSLGDDEGLLSAVTSANVACGFHAGDPTVMATTVGLAVSRGVVIGAHVSYPDRVGFGRRAMDVSAKDLRNDVAYQLGALDGISRPLGARVRYVKAHGALYNRCARDETQAGALLDAVEGYDANLAVLAQPASVLYDLARARGLNAAGEAFADRSYLPDGRLASRDCPGALVTDEQSVLARAVRIATEGQVTALDGTFVRVPAESICLHGDTPGAVGLAHAVCRGLLQAGVAVRSFASP